MKKALAPSKRAAAAGMHRSLDDDPGTFRAMGGPEVKMNRPALLVRNIPVGCADDFLNDWIEAHGYRTFGVRILRDSTNGTSLGIAYVQLMDSSRIDEAARALDGRTLHDCKLEARRAVLRSPIVISAALMKAAG